jgi:hypothetical protein
MLISKPMKKSKQFQVLAEIFHYSKKTKQKISFAQIFRQQLFPVFCITFSKLKNLNLGWQCVVLII